MNGQQDLGYQNFSTFLCGKKGIVRWKGDRLGYDVCVHDVWVHKPRLTSKLSDCNHIIRPDLPINSVELGG